MSSEVSELLRQTVTERAQSICEYCLFPQAVALHKHEIDHIVPTQHGGETRTDNLALSCMRCNRYKGPNIGSIDPKTGQLVPFFNPRVHRWSDHFALEGAIIRPLTSEARVTLAIFRINDEDRRVEREYLLQAGLYGVAPR